MCQKYSEFLNSLYQHQDLHLQHQQLGNFVDPQPQSNQTEGLLIENILLKFLFSEELLWCPNLESDETEITNYLSKWQDKSEDSNIADNEEALTQLMKSNYNFEDALGKKSEKNEIPSIYHEKITEEQ